MTITVAAGRFVFVLAVAAGKSSLLFCEPVPRGLGLGQERENLSWADDISDLRPFIPYGSVLFDNKTNKPKLYMDSKILKIQLWICRNIHYFGGPAV